MLSVLQPIFVKKPEYMKMLMTSHFHSRTHQLPYILSILLLLFSFQSLYPSAFVHAGAQPAPVMLARTWEPGLDIRGWWMSEKLDGIRGYWTGRQLISRSGKAFAVPDWFTQNFPSVPLDGELWTGRQQFSEVSRIVRRKTPGDRWKKVRYMIFDAPTISGGFEKRLDFARQWFQQHPTPHISLIKQERCRDEAQMRRKLAAIEAAGGEGLMLRRPESPYTVGRSRDLLKVKTFKDAEAVVVQHIPGAGKHAGRLGALLVVLPNGIQFSIGTGFTHAQRDNPPPIGSTITFKYQGLTKAGIPRFASFLRIREHLQSNH
ncbi:DNA ligase [Candidatus Entotheonellaceae bacterium PAL068K]